MTTQHGRLCGSILLSIEDNAWNIVEYDISSVAASQSTVYLRWTYEVKSARALPYSGWNVSFRQA